VHRTRIAEEQRQFALQILRNQLGRHVYPLHRLDRPTSGVLLFGKHPAIVQPVMAAFENREVQKIYLAIVRGYIPENEVIDYALKTERGEAQSAVTEYTRLGTVELPIPVGRYATARYSLAEARPLTGRMHQIRKHFAHICHYIIGDKRHGDWRHNKMFAEQLNSPYLLLHARRLTFRHPLTQELIRIEAPLPEHMRRLCTEFGWADVLAGRGYM
jgi:tRNA pseudouridine65 synthase